MNTKLRFFHLPVGAGFARLKTSTALFVGAFGQANPAPYRYLANADIYLAF